MKYINVERLQELLIEKVASGKIPRLDLSLGTSTIPPYAQWVPARRNVRSDRIPTTKWRYNSQTRMAVSPDGTTTVPALPFDWREQGISAPVEFEQPKASTANKVDRQDHIQALQRGIQGAVTGAQVGGGWGAVIGAAAGAGSAYADEGLAALGLNVDPQKVDNAISFITEVGLSFASGTAGAASSSGAKSGGNKLI